MLSETSLLQIPPGHWSSGVRGSFYVLASISLARKQRLRFYGEVSYLSENRDPSITQT